MESDRRSVTGPVVITGGAGFIGSHLADLLLTRGAAVRVIDDLSTGPRSNIAHLAQHPAFEFVEGDVRDRKLLHSVTAGASTIYHLAAVVGVHNVLDDPLRVVDDNMMGTKGVLEAARAEQCSVFIASTSEIYGRNEDVPFTEDSDRVLGPPQVARWSYSVSKAADELLGFGYAREHGLHVVVGRVFNTIGRRQVGHYGMVVPRFVRQALSGEPITVHGEGDQTRTFCDVRDVVRAMTLLMDTPAAAGQPFNIGSTREISVRDLANLVLEVVANGQGPSSEFLAFVPYEDAYADGYEEFPRRVPDISRIRELTGWEPTHQLEDTLRWIREGIIESGDVES